MRMKSVFSLCLSVALWGSIMNVSSSWAWGGSRSHAKLAMQNHASSSSQPMTETKRLAGMISTGNNNNLLGALNSFGVRDIEPLEFSSARDENIPGEMLEYARTALETDGRLQYQSPAQGLLRFRCLSSNCSVIRAEVTQGVQGQVVWATERPYMPSVWVNVHFLPDSKKFARQIVDKLAQDYQNALKQSPLKINIEE